MPGARFLEHFTRQYRGVNNLGYIEVLSNYCLFHPTPPRINGLMKHISPLLVQIHHGIWVTL